MIIICFACASCAFSIYSLLDRLGQDMTLETRGINPNALR